MNYFLGSHGTGKSTLSKEIQKINPHFPTMEGLSRSLSKGLDLTALKYDEVQKQTILNEIHIELHKSTHKVKEGIMSRSLIDQIVYSKFVAPELPVAEMTKLWRDELKYVGKIFYIPIEFDLEVEGIRSGIWGDKFIQQELQEELYSFLLNDVNYGLDAEKIIILSGSVEQRMEILKHHLKF